ncbi:MAG: radical SAM protein, partial [Bacillota bacterium]|nr:radical SAM protein [Bacillota bacterium]
LYNKNRLSKALICAGLEPFDSYDELVELVSYFRERTYDDIVIYTGFTEEELEDKLVDIIKYGNIIIKFGRFIPDDQEYFNELLGVKLASKNQYVVHYK